MRIERESREDRGFFVRPVDADGQLVDPTELPVAVAFAADGDRPEEWHAATWEEGGPFPAPPPLGSAYSALLEIGGEDSGATVELEAGTWNVYVRVTAAAEIPVIPAGILEVR